MITGIVSGIAPVLAGADVCHMTAALLKHGPAYLVTVLQQLQQWMQDNEYESVEQLKGSVSQLHSVQPVAYERANYMSLLQNYK